MACEDTCGRVAPLFLDYQEQLSAFIGKRVHDREQTQEIAHQVLLKLYNHCEQLPHVHNLRAWLYQITRNAVYDYFREHQRIIPLAEDIELPAGLERDLQQELGALVVPLLGLLPETYAEPLRLSDLEGLPQQEIADRLGLSLSGAKSRIQRGREKLKALFSKCCHLELDRQGNLIGATIREDCNPLQPLRRQLATSQEALS